MIGWEGQIGEDDVRRIVREENESGGLTRLLADLITRCGPATVMREADRPLPWIVEVGDPHGPAHVIACGGDLGAAIVNATILASKAPSVPPEGEG